MTRNQGSCIQNGSKLGQSMYQEDGPEKSTWKLGNKLGILMSHTSSNVAYCEIPHKKETLWTKDTICNSWSLGPIFHPIDKANIITDYLENQFRVHDFSYCDHDDMRRLKWKPFWQLSMKTLLLISDPVTSKNNTTLEIRKRLWFWCHFKYIYLRHLPRRPLVYLTHLFNHCLRLGHSSASWKGAKFIILPRPGKDHKFPPNT
jgi:hypothetical protein